MNTQETIKDINRLTEILHEAKDIVTRLNDSAGGRIYNEFENIPVYEIQCSEPHTHTRFCNVCTSMGINTVAQLLRTPSRTFFNQRNMGQKTLDTIRESISRQFNVTWV